MKTYETVDGDMLDAICAQHYPEVPLDQSINVVLAGNKGLAALGPILPERLRIVLPDIDSIEVKPTIRLWED